MVVNATEDSLQRVLAQGCWSELARFGAGGTNGTARGAHDAFDVLRSGEPVGRVEWALSGLHNQMNALAAIAAAEHVGVAPAEAAPRRSASFRNVRRRMELRGTVERPRRAITVYDDFAHHPTAIRTTLDGLRQQARRRRAPPGPHPRGVRAAQQHHEAGHHGGPAAVEPGGGRPVVLPQRRPGLGCGARPWRRWARGPQVADAIEPLVAQVAAAAQPGDHIVCMSNGGFGGVHDKLLAPARATMSDHARAAQLIETLKLQPHPEGGWYREMFRSSAQVLPADGRTPRDALTTIYFLLEADQHSRWHRVLSDEVWIYLEGAPLALWTSDAALRTRPPTCGSARSTSHGTRPQHAVPAGQWQAARADRRATRRRLHAGRAARSDRASTSTTSPSCSPTATRRRCCATTGRTWAALI